MKRGQEYTDYINASFIDVCIAAPYVFGATWDALLYEHVPLSMNTALHTVRSISTQFSGQNYLFLK